MRSPLFKIFLIPITASLLFSCKKNEVFQSDPLSDYIPLSTGKYITYQLDSTVFVNFNTQSEKHIYQEKQVIDLPVPDALGRPSYRVFRYLRDSAGILPWAPAGTFFITPTGKTTELIENNLRYVKLSLPIKQDFSWNANRYLPETPLRQLYSFTNDGDMKLEEWNSSYSDLGATLNLNGKMISNVITINGVNQFDNIPININVFASVDFMQEKYAKGIGLVYQEWAMWDFQPPHDNIPVAQKHGFILKRSMIDHN